jgi:hypothetical protein
MKTSLSIFALAAFAALAIAPASASTTNLASDTHKVSISPTVPTADEQATTAATAVKQKVAGVCHMLPPSGQTADGFFTEAGCKRGGGRWLK